MPSRLRSSIRCPRSARRPVPASSRRSASRSSRPGATPRCWPSSIWWARCSTTPPPTSACPRARASCSGACRCPPSRWPALMPAISATTPARCAASSNSWLPLLSATPTRCGPTSRSTSGCRPSCVRSRSWLMPSTSAARCSRPRSTTSTSVPPTACVACSRACRAAVAAPPASSSASAIGATLPIVRRRPARRPSPRTSAGCWTIAWAAAGCRPRCAPSCTTCGCATCARPCCATAPTASPIAWP